MPRQYDAKWMKKEERSTYFNLFKEENEQNGNKKSQSISIAIYQFSALYVPEIVPPLSLRPSSVSEIVGFTSKAKAQLTSIVVMLPNHSAPFPRRQ